MIRRIAAITILLAFVLPLMPVGQADPLTSTGWTTAVVNNQGHSVPFGWESKVETTTFWLDADEQGNECSAFAKTSPCLLLRRPGSGTNEAEEQHTLFDVASLDPAVLPNTPFVAPFGIMEADLTIYQLEANLVLQSGQPQTIRVQLTADGVDVGARATVQMTGAVPQYPIIPVSGGGLADHDQYTGTISFGESGVTIVEGQELGMRIYYDTATIAAGVGAGSAFPTELHYGDSDSAPSWIRLMADSGKINTWTEDTTGLVGNVFPGGSGLSPEDRAFDLFVAHGNALGDEALQQDNGGSNLFHHHQIKGIRAPDGAEVYNTKFVAQNPNPQDSLGTADTPGFDLFKYKIFYAADTAVGTYRIVVEDRRDDWEYVQTIIVGGTGVDLQIVGDATHSVNPLEPTEFTFEVLNTGAVAGEVGIEHVGSLGSWQLSLQPKLVVAAPGVPAVVKATITPPADNKVGDVKEFTFRATSARDGVSDTEKVTVRTVAEVTKGVDIYSRVPTVTTGPGVTRETLLGVRNLATFQEDYVITHQNVPAGWRVQLEPASLHLFSKSDDSVRMKVTAPVNAVAGTNFVARLIATSVNDPTVTDVLELPVSIAIKDGFTINVKAPETNDNGLRVFTHAHRDEGVDGDQSCLLIVTECDSAWNGNVGPDSDFDESSQYRIEVTNNGDRADTIVFEPVWAAPTGTSLSGGADGNNEVPDGWRFAFVEEDGVPRRGGISAFTGRGADISNGAQANPADPDVNALFDRSTPHAFTVPAHTTKFVYAQLIWKSPIDTSGNSDNCGGREGHNGDFGTGYRDCHPSLVGAVDVTAFSKNDPTIRKQFRLQSELGPVPLAADRIGTNSYKQAFRDVSVERDANQALAQSILSPGQTGAAPAVFRMRATNLANEFDTLRVTVPSSLNGWTYDLTVRGTVNVAGPGATEHDSVYSSTSGNEDWQTGSARTPNANTIAGCGTVKPEGGQRMFECTLGIYDEVAFDVTATPPSTGKIGDATSFKVSVESKESFQTSKEPLIKRSISEELSVKLVGSFLYDIRSPACPIQTVSACAVNVVPGGSVSVPYSIENKGTQGDDFLVSLSKVPAPATGWKGSISSIGTVYIPPGKVHHGFVNVRAPSTATAGAEELYRLKVESIGGDDVRLVDITAKVVAKATSLSFKGAPSDYLVIPGVDVKVNVEATRLTGAATSVFIDAQQAYLPTGWSILTGDGATANYGTDGIALHSMDIRIPVGEIGNSRVVLPVTANDGTGTAYTELVLSLNPDGFGFTLETADVTNLVVPGSSVQIPFTVRSNVLGTDTVTLTHAAVPTGWQLTFDQTQVPLQALETAEVIATVSAPAGLPPGTERLFVITGTSQGNSAITDTLNLNVETAISLFQIAIADERERFLAPLETETFAMTVYNNGTARDDIAMTAILGPAYAGLVDVTFSKDTFTLDPTESTTLTAKVTLPAGIVSGARIPITFAAASTSTTQESLGEVDAVVSVLHHRNIDVDGDLIDEYAIDRNRDVGKAGSDGYDEFIDQTPMQGINAVALDMASFLTDAAITSWTVTETDAGGNSTQVFRFIVDANLALVTNPNEYAPRWDFFLDTDGDGLPNLFYNPDAGAVDELTTSKDVTKDGIREYFIDVNNDDILDVFYDLTTGRFGPLIPLDTNDDGIPDAFVVDLNGNGIADQNEPVLFTKDGRITSITEQVDVDGDGKLDSAIDEDGDGKVDCFRPFGSSKCIPIKHKDVNGDGVEDWTYDSNGDGREDRFYDPVTGKTGSIDSGSEFVRALGDYWYVGAVFALVLALFVVLMVVTRR